MNGRLVLALSLLVFAPVTGCIGNEEASLEEQRSAAVPEVDVNGSTDVYRPGAAGSVDIGEALGDLPAPVSLGQTVDHPLFEPTIGVTSEGNLFVSNAESDPVLEATSGQVPDDAEFSGILRSSDQGETWEDVTGEVGPASVPPNTFDPYVYVDQDTDRVYNLDMIGLNCNWVRFSDDEAETWTSNPLGCGQPPVLDHPTIFAGEPTTLETTLYENVVYLCVNRVADSACATSLDGGLTWSPFQPVFEGVEANEVTTDLVEAVEENFCGGLNAHGTTGPDGTAYLPKGQCGQPMVAISEDNGLTWEKVTISENVASPGHEVAFAVDDQGNAFAFWIDGDRKPVLATSTDGGYNWNEPVDVAPPNVSTTSHPTIAAGENGSIAMAFVGTTTNETYDDMPANATWNGYLVTALNATAEDPALTSVSVNDPEHPIGKGVCGGTRCRAPNAGGGIGDFIDVTIDDEGRPWAAFVDVCHEECEEQGGPPDAQPAKGLVGTFNEGPSLVGEPDALDPLVEDHLDG